jgi:multiple sugar transport system substrate-binding protein
VPSFVSNDDLFKAAFDIYKPGYPANEFTGLPVADELMRSFDEQLQKTLNGSQSVDDMLKVTQTSWLTKF